MKQGYLLCGLQTVKQVSKSYRVAKFLFSLYLTIYLSILCPPTSLSSIFLQISLSLALVAPLLVRSPRDYPLIPYQFQR